MFHVKHYRYQYHFECWVIDHAAPDKAYLMLKAVFEVCEKYVSSWVATNRALR